MKCDTHVHTKNSHDGKLPIQSIVDLAKAQGLCYLCTTDHLDYDFEYGKNRAPISWPPLDLPAYYKEWQIAKTALDNDKNNSLTLCFGIEASYDKSEKAKEKYKEIIREYPFDAVINSVHCVDGYDVYFKMAFLFKRKKHVYRRYLETILESLDAPYPYDIVAHIGYIAHGAPVQGQGAQIFGFSRRNRRHTQRHNRARKGNGNQLSSQYGAGARYRATVLRFGRTKDKLRLGRAPRRYLQKLRRSRADAQRNRFHAPLRV